MSATLIPTPPLKVSRLLNACTRCRKAKTKCDGGLPACQACVRADRASECTGANDQFARGRDRSYVTALETRIDRLQEQIEKRRHNQQTHSNSTQYLSPPPSGPYDRTSIGHIPKQKDASDVDALVSDFGYLYVSPP